MPYNSKFFGIVIGKLRAEENLSQKVMANRIGIARSHLVALENGKKVARLDTVWKIAEAFNMKSSELIMLVELEDEENGHSQLENVWWGRRG